MVMFTATVATAFGQPTGTVNFLDFGNSIGSSPLNSGLATLTTASLITGPHAIVAVYVCDAGHNGSSSPELDEIIQSANQTSTNVILTVATTALAGPLMSRAAALTANVNPGAGSEGGTVMFYDGDRLLGYASVDNTGQGSINSGGLAIGVNALRAAYSGNNNFGGSISPNVSVYRSPRPH